VDRELAEHNAARAKELIKAEAITSAEWDKESSAVRQLAARADVASAALSSAELDLDYAHIRSPIRGRIGRALVTPGNLVGPTMPSPLAVVVSVDPLYVYVDVDEAHGLALARADHPVAQVGFTGEEGTPHTAPVDFVDNRVDPSTGTLKVRVVVKNEDGALRDGLFARVRLPEAAPHAAILVSDRAIATDQDRRFVWVVAPDGKVEHRVVELGPLERGLRVVRKGLSPSDRVIVRGLQRVRPGAVVTADTISMRAVDGEASAQPTAGGHAP
jgi:multidrug efflux system membrane fusion protein